MGSSQRFNWNWSVCLDAFAEHHAAATGTEHGDTVTLKMWLPVPVSHGKRVACNTARLPLAK